VGFDQEKADAEERADVERRLGLGLRGIGERVSILQGVFTVESSPGEGTALYVDIPIPRAASAEETRSQRETH